MTIVKKAFFLILLTFFVIASDRVTANEAPVGVDDSYTTNPDSPLDVPASQGVLQNDTDADGDSLTAQMVSPPLFGFFSLNPDGSFGYTPFPGFIGEDYFAYQAYDGELSSETVLGGYNRGVWDQ